MKRILKFLNLLDESGEAVSLTNIALIVLIAKMALAPVVDWPSVVAVITAFGNYSHKRYIASKGDSSASSNGQESP